MTARVAFALAALCLLGGGCGSDSNGEPGAATRPMTTPMTTAPETPPGTTGEGSETDSGTGTEAAGQEAYEVWIVDRDFLRLVWRPGPSTDAVAAAALELLLAEAAATAIPPGTETLGADLDGNVATVDLSGEFGLDGRRLRVAQVVYTVTQFENVRSVEVLVDGEPLADLPGPHTRADFEEDVAPIIVESPTGLEPVASPIVVAGTANVFEANVLITVLGDLGQELVATFATATCGTGCRGDFEKAVAVPTPAEQAVTLVLAEEDASSGEGRPPYRVEVPLVLVP
jgi:hypothetical protein